VKNREDQAVATYESVYRESVVKLTGFSRDEKAPDGSGRAFFTESGSSSDTA